MTDEFTCGHCGETFEKAWSDKEVDTELAETFPNVNKANCSLVCDDCYKTLMDESQLFTTGEIEWRK